MVLFYSTNCHFMKSKYCEMLSIINELFEMKAINEKEKDIFINKINEVCKEELLLQESS